MSPTIQGSIEESMARMLRGDSEPIRIWWTRGLALECEAMAASGVLPGFESSAGPGEPAIVSWDAERQQFQGIAVMPGDGRDVPFAVRLDWTTPAHLAAAIARAAEVRA